MNDKFSRLILTIKNNLASKNREREEVIERKKPIVSEIAEIGARIQSLEDSATSLEGDLSAYKKYPIHVLFSILYSVVSVLVELMVLAMFVVYNWDLWWSVLNISHMYILGGIVSPLTFGLVLAVTKFFYTTCKSEIKASLDSKKIRDKYKTSDEIQEKLNLVKQEIQNLIDELNTQKDEEHELNVMLEDISRDIAILEEKLGMTSNAFVDATLKIEDAGVEERLDAEYEKSGIEEQVQALDAGEAGKRFVITKREEGQA